MMFEETDPRNRLGRAALLVVHTNTFFIELIRLARLLTRDGHFIPVFVFYPYTKFQRDVENSQSEGFLCLDRRGASFLGRPEEMPINFVRKARKALVHWGTVGARVARRFTERAIRLLRRLHLVECAYQLVILISRQLFLDRFLRRMKPAIVVLGGDMVGYDTATFVRACHHAGVPVAIVPSTMSNGLEQAEVYFDNPNYGMRSWINRYAGARYPKWVREHKGRRLLREHGGRVLAMEWLKLSPPLPWIFNSGFADVIAVESRAMHDYYAAAGLSEDRMVVTGSPSDDAIANALSDRITRRQILYSELGLCKDKPLLLTALPPDFLYVTGGRPQCDFAAYIDLVRFWVTTVSAVSNYNKVICLHPSVDLEDMRFLETKDIRLASAPTAELIPLCDIYVTSVSSTIRWAIACGKPVVNYDVYRYRYDDYANLPGVLTIEEQDQFANTLRRLSEDPAYYKEIAELQSTISAHWGRLDGHSGSRIVALLKALAAKSGA